MVVYSRKIYAYSLTSLFAMTIHLFYLLYSYHELMVAKYGCKREKSQEAKQRSAEEQKPMREMERAVDVDLFLEAQEQWAKDSPHRLVILHEIFLHAAYEGQKKAEQVVCRGCHQHMPRLDPEVGIPAIQLVLPEVDREQLLELYLEVYKLHRLPSSPPGELAILEEISSVLPHHPPEEKGTPNIQKLVSPKGFHSTPEQTVSMRTGRLHRQKLSQSAQCTSESLVNCGNSEEEIKRLYRKKAHSGPERR